MAKDKPINPYTRLRNVANGEIKKYKGRDRVEAFHIDWNSRQELFHIARTASSLGYELHIEIENDKTINYVFYKKVNLFYV